MSTTAPAACPCASNSDASQGSTETESKGSETLSVMTPLLPVFPMSRRAMKIFFLFVLFLITSALHAQQPGVDCAPIQGQGWSGCAPINSPKQQQQSQAPQPPPERWQDHWGAIATYEPGGVLGVATNMLDENQAKQSAMADCEKKGGGSNCKFQLAYRNGCAVLLVGGKAFNVASDATIDRATQSGMKICTANGNPNCHVYYSACSLPVRIQ